MTKITAVYKLTIPPSNHFYIGASTNLDGRIASHLSNLRAGKHPNDILQSAFRVSPTQEIEIEVLSVCTDSDALAKAEGHYIKEYINDPLCCNKYVTTKHGAHGRNFSTQHKTNLAASIVRLRPSTIEFVSPQGKRYVTDNVSAFAAQYGLSQSAMNQVATGDIAHAKGWSLTNNTYPMPLGTVKRPHHISVDVVDFKGRVRTLTTDNYKGIALAHNVHPKTLRSWMLNDNGAHSAGLVKVKDIQLVYDITDANGEKWIIPDSHGSRRVFFDSHNIEYREWQFITRVLNIKRQSPSKNGWTCQGRRSVTYETTNP